MSVLIATPKATNANSYVTVADADLILGRRLYTTKWDNASTKPDAENYLANGGASSGASSVAVDTGTGTFTSKCKVKFAGHDTLYTVSEQLAVAGPLKITPVLTANVADGEAVERITANEKEKALMWATSLFDYMLVWNGVKRTVEQARAFPMSGIVDPWGYAYDYDTIPPILEVATAEYGLVLTERNRFKMPAAVGLGVSEVRADTLVAKIDSKEIEPAIPDNILSILSPLGSLEPEAQGETKIVPLART